MVNLETLTARSFRYYELGRLSVAASVAIVLAPIVAVCLLEPTWSRFVSAAARCFRAIGCSPLGVAVLTASLSCVRLGVASIVGVAIGTLVGRTSMRSAIAPLEEGK
jgi:hypothetical protein